MKVSVIYCTARKGGFDILKESMQNQSYNNFEVIIVDELKREASNFFNDDRFREVYPPPKKPGMFWNLSASLNEGVRHAIGDLIVLLQDYIWVPKDGLLRFVSKVIYEGPCLVSGVGHQYKEPSKVDHPEGLYSVWDKFPGEPSGEIVFEDPRMKDRSRGFYVCNPVEWEANWSCFSKQIWKTIGGFDEEFDAGWGYDNVNFAERSQLAGYNVFIDTENEVKCYSHIHLFNEQNYRDKAPNNQNLWHRKYRDMHKHSASWKLNYA